jgi:hypothetical protein
MCTQLILACKAVSYAPLLTPLRFSLLAHSNGTHTVGDGSGCAWKTKRVANAINASCLYQRFDAVVEAFNHSYCFKHCPDGGQNKTTVCYRDCYGKTVTNMTDAEAIQPWTDAFKQPTDLTKGGCPTVHVPEMRMSPELLNPVWKPNK